MYKGLSVILLVLVGLIGFSGICFGLTDAQIDLHNKYFEQGSQLIEPYVLRAGRSRRGTLDTKAKEKIAEGISFLKKAIAINRENWSAYWVIGKGYQVLGEHDNARRSFRSAYVRMSSDPNVAREYMIECINTGEFKKGIYVGEKASELSPTDSGLKANLSIALLLNKNVDEALEVAKKSLAANPSDAITQQIVQVIEDIKSGKSAQPQSMAEFEQLSKKASSGFPLKMIVILLVVIVIVVIRKFSKKDKS